MKINQKGFGAVEGLLILILVSILGFTGYYVYHSRNNATSTYNNAASTGTNVSNSPQNLKKYTDSSGTYSFSYPENWAVSEKPYSGDFLSDSVSGKNVQIVPESSPSITSDVNLPNYVSLVSYKTTNTNEVIEGLLGTLPNQPQTISINGVRSQYVKVNSSGYTDEDYFLTHNTITLVVTFREKQSSTLGGNSTTFDATKDAASFNELVKSIKFQD
jgi:hypothetical protein